MPFSCGRTGAERSEAEGRAVCCKGLLVGVSLLDPLPQGQHLDFNTHSKLVGAFGVAFRRNPMPKPPTRLVLAVHQKVRELHILIRSGAPCQRLHFSAWPRPCEVIRALEVHPELGRGLQRLAEQPRRLGGDASLAAHDLVDPLDRHADVVSEGDL